MSIATSPLDILGRHTAKRGGYKRRWLLMLGASAAAVAGGSLILSPARSDVPRYVMESLQRGTLEVSVTATGLIEPSSQVDVGAEISGLIKQVFVDFNSAVSAGDRLAIFDTDQLTAEVAQNRATLEEAQAGLVQAEATVKEAARRYERVQSLARDGFSSHQDLENALANLERAEATRASAKAHIELQRATLTASETKLNKAVIRAPIGGTVLERIIEPGQVVAAEFQTPKLFVIAGDLRRLRLRAKVAEGDIALVRIGQKATFTVDAYPERKFEGTIEDIHNAPKTTDGVVNYEAVLRVANDDLSLKPGMTATAAITVLQEEDVLLAPNSALRFRPDDVPAGEKPTSDSKSGGTIWLMGENGSPHAVTLKLGHTDHRQTVVLSPDLRAGTQVAVAARRAVE